MRNVVAYVDGFNLYHAIVDLSRPHLKWLDLWKVAESICGQGETLRDVYYFTAPATWIPGSAARHQEYVKALAHVGVKSVIGHFKEKRRECRRCGATWVGHEEKETDVAIATQLVSDAFRDQFHRALIISADSDLAPAIKTVQHYFPRKAVNVVAPPGRFSHARDLKPQFQLTAGRLERCLLPETARDAEGGELFRRPASYNP